MAITRNDGRIRRMTDRELSRALARHYDGLELFANGAAEDAVLEFQRAEAEIRELAREAWSRIRAQGGAGRDLPTVEYLRMVRRRLEERGGSDAWLVPASLRLRRRDGRGHGAWRARLP